MWYTASSDPDDNRKKPAENVKEATYGQEVCIDVFGGFDGF